MNMHCGSVTCLQVHDWILCCEPTTAADQKVMEKAKGDRLRAKCVTLLAASARWADAHPSWVHGLDTLALSSI